MSLRADGVSLRYTRNPVVHEASCTAERGKITALIGPNGSGKSTLLRCLARGMKPLEGSVLLEEQDLYALNARQAARRIGYVPQESAAGFEFTVGEIVALGADAAARDAPPRAARIENALALLDLRALAEKSLLSLSGGERQRAAIARAIAQDGAYLLLDEPTAHLDLRHQIRLLQEMQRLTREQRKAVLVVLHDLNLAATYADEIVLMKEGRVAAAGTPESVFSPERLASVYQTYVYVKRHPASGRPWVLAAPYRPDGEDAPPDHHPSARAVHLLCGGGTGTALMAALRAARVPVTAGILSPLDTDAETAAALGIAYTPDAPFSPLSSAALAADALLRRAARQVVVADFPIGPGNLALLEAAAEAAREGQEVILIAGAPIRERDFTGGAGQRQWERLRAQARVVEDPEALVALILESPPTA